MKTLVYAFAGMIGGFLLGIALSSLMGIIGMMLFKQPVGIKYLPYFTAVFGAVILPALARRKANT